MTWNSDQTAQESLALAQEYYGRKHIGFRAECVLHLRTYYERRIAGETTGNPHLDSGQDQIAGMILCQLGEALDQAHCQLGLCK
jgi:hypothetical protein